MLWALGLLVAGDNHHMNKSKSTASAAAVPYLQNLNCAEFGTLWLTAVWRLQCRSRRQQLSPRHLSLGSSNDPGAPARRALAAADSSVVGVVGSSQRCGLLHDVRCLPERPCRLAGVCAHTSKINPTASALTKSTLHLPLFSNECVAGASGDRG